MTVMKNGKGATGAGLVLAAALFATAAWAEGPATAIMGATVFDATGAAPHVANVVIEDGRIVAVGPKVKAPKGAKVIKAKGLALLPGFYDVHTHWTPAGDPGLTPEIATAYVKAGVTTVDDFHEQPESFAPRRRWIASLASPHVNFTARMSTPGGHGADWADENTTRWVNTPQSARTEVDGLLKYKPDLIKAFTDGWRYGLSADNTSMGEDTLAALVDEAHKNGLKVLTHTVTVKRGKEAAEAKVDVIAHSLQDEEIDQETVDLMVANHTAYAPTLAVYEPGKGGKPLDPNDPRTAQSLKKFDNALHNVKVLHDAGVLVALGTDAGMTGTPHGVSTLHEMELLVKAGLTPTDALMVGTANSAKAVGQLADRGTIEPGKRADIVLIKGQPWVNISDVRNTEDVFIDGKLVYGPGVSLPAANSERSMPAIKVEAPMIDDFESDRSNRDTLRLDDMDGGIDRTVQVSQTIARADGDGHALSLDARMAEKKGLHAGVIIPLSRGSVEPVDASTYKGVRFEIRGDGGDYAFDVNTLNGSWTKTLTAGPQWSTVEVPFTALAPEAGRGGAKGPWSGKDLLQVEFGGARAPGSTLWLEVDNVSFY
ncbi:CIA30 family protein [Phenylobacterium sp.]|uniref:CIA30 family protein n=1 Tax=Phenylobacterium sp. TaxID=1871053 RepID=UPI0035ADD519